MHPMRWTASLLILLLVASCGSSSPAGGVDGGDATQTERQAPDPTVAPPASEGGGGDGDADAPDVANPVSSGDLEELAERLKAPNSTQTEQTADDGMISTTYVSNVTVDGLLGYYNLRIPETGLEIYSSEFADGSQTWLFAEGGDASRFGGSVVIGPGEGGTSVVVTVTTGE